MSNKDFNQMLKDLEGCKDVGPIIKAQKNTLLRYEEINEMLRQFLDLSNTTQSMLLENYTSHTRTLIELKKDLEVSFRRIRDLKVKLKDKYPDAFEATSAAIKELEEINRHFQEHDELDKSLKTETNKNSIENGSGADEQVVMVTNQQTQKDIFGESLVTECGVVESQSTNCGFNTNLNASKQSDNATSTRKEGD